MVARSIGAHLGSKLTRSLRRWVWCSCLAASSAAADPGYYVLSPYDREGVTSVELRYWTVKPDGDIETTWPELAFSHGINSRWTTLLLASWIGSSAEATRLSLASWQNVVLLTQGEWPVDLALFGALTRLEGDRPGATTEFGPLLQTEFGPLQMNLNLIFERVRRDHRARPTQLKYQWQLRRHVAGPVQFGLQGFGELGPWDSWLAHAQQSHRAGPALFATLPPGGAKALQIDAALLVGKTYGEVGRMVSVRMFWPF